MAAFVSFRTGNILTGTGAALQALRRVVVTESVTVGMAALRFGAVVLEFAYQDCIPAASGWLVVVVIPGDAIPRCFQLKQTANSRSLDVRQ